MSGGFPAEGSSTIRSPILLGPALVALGLAAAPALAQSGINLAWSDCAALGGTQNRSFACDTNAGTSTLVGTFVLAANLAQVSGSEMVLDLISQQATLPAWWELKFAGSCRPLSLSIAAYNGDGATCIDWASGQSTVAIASYLVNDPNVPYAPGPNTARIKCISAVPVTALADVLGNTEYGVFQLSLNNAKTVGSPRCAGCTNPVCIVLNSVNVTTSGNLNNTRLQTGTSPGSNMATWQGTGADCAAVPVRNMTWARVKTLYR